MLSWAVSSRSIAGTSYSVLVLNLHTEKPGSTLLPSSASEKPRHRQVLLKSVTSSHELHQLLINPQGEYQGTNLTRKCKGILPFPTPLLYPNLWALPSSSHSSHLQSLLSTRSYILKGGLDSLFPPPLLFSLAASCPIFLSYRLNFNTDSCNTTLLELQELRKTSVWNSLFFYLRIPKTKESIIKVMGETSKSQPAPLGAKFWPWMLSKETQPTSLLFR